MLNLIGLIGKLFSSILKLNYDSLLKNIKNDSLLKKKKKKNNCDSFFILTDINPHTVVSKCNRLTVSHCIPSIYKTW